MRDSKNAHPSWLIQLQSNVDQLRSLIANASSGSEVVKKGSLRKETKTKRATRYRGVYKKCSKW